MGHARLGGGDLRILRPQGGGLGPPARVGAGFEIRRRGQHLIGIDKQAARDQRRRDRSEQAPLGRVFQVMDRERRDDQVERARRKRLAVVADHVADVRSAGEASPSRVEHRRREVDQRQGATRMRSVDHGGEQAGARAQIEHAHASRRLPLRYELHRGAVECRKAGNEPAPRGIVLVGDGVEGGGDRHGCCPRRVSGGGQKRNQATAATCRPGRG